MRETLLSQGIDPAQAFLAIVYPDDVATLVAVVVASSDQMLRVDIDYSVGIEDYGEAMNRGHVVSWENDVAVIRSEERKVVDIALELLTSESRGD